MRAVRQATAYASLLALSLGLLFGQTGARVERDMVYSETGSRSLKLDLYLPAGAPGQGALPVIVWIHGGGWVSGHKDQTPAVRMIEQGYAVASIEYRFLTEAVFPAQIHDAKAAVRWLRAHADQYNLDPDRIGAWGASAGGHLAAMLGTSAGVEELEGPGDNLEYSSRVQAVVDFYGPIDVLQMYPALGSLRETMLRVFPELSAASPLNYVSPDDAPFLIVHGNRDELVPVSQSELLAESLEKAGVEVRLEIVEGAGHSLHGAGIERIVDEFFARYLQRMGPNACRERP